MLRNTIDFRSQIFSVDPEVFDLVFRFLNFTEIMCIFRNSNPQLVNPSKLHRRRGYQDRTLALRKPAYKRESFTAPLRRVMSFLNEPVLIVSLSHRGRETNLRIELTENSGQFHNFSIFSCHLDVFLFWIFALYGFVFFPFLCLTFFFCHFLFV